ncbi:DUF421 domain-containing protein [Nocardia uniformis]|uniref:DUF421 domain-containing protein n=1 Tax=Nocardia uniformis TaxID=53432 RepID=A0A849BW34_9NOCA|nr:YetF domain-containing protein [Nocardia uniformis]NNH70772.1 DUF421 domain-containing protein [Nocardia uniformis]
MWQDLLMPGTEVPEKIIRTIAVYFAVALLLRVAGKRDLAQLNTFDLVVMLLLSNVVQNAVIGDDNSLAGGLIGAVTLVATNAVVVRASVKYPGLSRVFEGKPDTLIKNGEYLDNRLWKLGLRRADIGQAIRNQGARSVKDVAEATMEPGGTVLVQLRDKDRTATKADIDRLLAEIRKLEARLDR